MRRFSCIIALVLAVSAYLGASTASLAQDATPDAGPAPEFPLIPDPALCTEDGRTTEEILAIWFPESGTPVADGTEQVPEQDEVTIPVGIPAGDGTTAEIIDTVYELTSCARAGGITRVSAFYTDDFLANLGFVGFGLTQEEAAASLEATPEPVPESGEVQVVAVTDAMQLEDGRVGAFVVSRNPYSSTTDYTIFERVDERWLIDEVIGFRPVVAP